MDDELEETNPPRTPQLSKTPSWIMLGFILGALAVYTLPRPEKKVPAPPMAAKTLPAVPTPPEKPTVERAVFFEDVFAQYSGNAVWQNDLTEVAFWNAPRRAFSDCYEVMRVSDKFYFRSIPHLTRPVLKEGVPPDSPLQFTTAVKGSVTANAEYQAGSRNNLDSTLIIRPAPPTPVTAPPKAPSASPPVELPLPVGK